jgi:zinc D-Ala-D-Ala dipeptidase
MYRIKMLLFLFPFALGQANFQKAYKNAFMPCPKDSAMEKAGLVDVQKLDPDIRVELKYSGLDNFAGRDLYGCLEKAYLAPSVAKMLSRASALLIARRPDLRLLVYDAARPFSIQQVLWDNMPKPENQKHIYLARPSRGSIHNYGAAVDLTLCDKNGKPLDMGTPFDFFGKKAQPRFEQALLLNGELSKDQIDNRQLLRKVMLDSGFLMVTSEWWHFNACSLKKAKAWFKRVP